jgi:hypothetical protein
MSCFCRSFRAVKSDGYRATSGFFDRAASWRSSGLLPPMQHPCSARSIAVSRRQTLHQRWVPGLFAVNSISFCLRRNHQPKHPSLADPGHIATCFSPSGPHRPLFKRHLQDSVKMLALRSIAAPAQRQCWRAAPRAAVTFSIQVRQQLSLLRIDKQLALTPSPSRARDSTRRKTGSRSSTDRRMHR